MKHMKLKYGYLTKGMNNKTPSILSNSVYYKSIYSYLMLFFFTEYITYIVYKAYRVDIDMRWSGHDDKFIWLQKRVVLIRAFLSPSFTTYL